MPLMSFGIGETTSWPYHGTGRQATQDSRHAKRRRATQESSKSGTIASMFVFRILTLLGESRRLIGWSVFFGLVFTGLGILPPLLVRQMILWLEADAVSGSFLTLGLLLATIFLLRGIARYLYGLSSHIAAYRTLHRLTNRVYQRLQSMSPSFLNRHHSGSLVARSVGDVEAIEDFIAHGIPETLLAIVIPITMSIVLLLINWQLALIALIPLPIVAVLLYVLQKKTRNYWRGVRSRFAEVSARMLDFISGATVLQSFGRQGQAARKLEEQSRDYRDHIIRANRWSLVPAGVVQVLSGYGTVLVVAAGAWMVSSSTGPRLEVEVADLVVFLMYMGQIFLPFLRLANMTDSIQKAIASAERVFELLDMEPDIQDSPTARIPDDPRFDIQFEQVEFSYNDNEPVLQGVSFDVAQDEIVALVGETGVGKSTACHLLVRFYDVLAGSIKIGGVDVRSLPLEYLRSQVAFVSQDIFLFEGTIRENLLIGDPDASQEHLEAAIRAAEARSFIEAFPEGLETVVGERGIRLSGGQKQRIGIARALLKDAPILVLDEATSAIDAETEGAIKDAIMRAATGRTVLIIAHRPSTIMAADRIVVLEEGKVVETGSYQELLESDSAFSRLCQLGSIKMGETLQ
jgi:ATP-binding cassette subfamily B protein/subfamily B ATP-binding cassette protein MsbA